MLQAHWNDKVVEIVKEKGDEAPALELYQASKTLAEKAAWKFVDDNKGKIGFDLVTVLPTFVSYQCSLFVHDTS